MPTCQEQQLFSLAGQALCGRGHRRRLRLVQRGGGAERIQHLLLQPALGQQRVACNRAGRVN
jgi:hypothetical protein